MYPLSEEDRWYIISKWREGSINVPQVAHFLNCHISTVYRIIDHYRHHGNVRIGHKSGRPPALNSIQMKQLDQIIQQNRSATAAELLSLTHFDTTERTIQRYRLLLGYRPRKSVIQITSNNIDRQQRYRFAALHQHANIKKYIFKDEYYVGLSNTQQIVWCKRGERTPRKEISSLRANVKLIGFIWWNGCVFCRFHRWLKGDAYRDLVNEALSPHIRRLNGFSYVSDEVKWHRSAHFQQWCEQNNIELCQ
jgi:transposase